MSSPSHLHETINEMLRHQPTMVARLLSGPLGIALPPWDRATLR